MAGHEPGVLQETAQVGVVIAQGGGADQELLPVAVQDPEDQLPERRPDLGFGQLPQLLPQGLAVVGGGLAEQLRVILLEVPAQVPKGRHGVDITDVELKFTLVGLNLRLDSHMISRGEGPGAFGQHFVPDPGHHGAALVPQDQGEVGLAGLVRAALRLAHQEILLHGVAFLKVGNQLMGHDSSLWR